MKTKFSKKTAKPEKKEKTHHPVNATEDIRKVRQHIHGGFPGELDDEEENTDSKGFDRLVD